MSEKSFFKEKVLEIALPITIQSLIQASFGAIDQFMIGQLGTDCVAGVGLGSKFASIFTVIAAAISTAASILIAQYVGKKENEGINKSFFTNLFIIIAVAIFFSVISIVFPYNIMKIYSNDADIVAIAGSYLKIIGLGFIPVALSYLISVLLRCVNYVKFPLYASILSAMINIGLNYLLIFGNLNFPKMGVEGAAYATTISRIVEVLILICMVVRLNIKKVLHFSFRWTKTKKFGQTLMTILLPIIACEFLWSLGENVYSVVYGRIGADACAAMTLTNPIQSIMIGALTGISSASGIIIGKRIGEGNYEKAYMESKKFMLYGLIGACMLSILIILLKSTYVSIFKVDENVRILAQKILVVYGFIGPIKVENMILGGGILRSGGKTKYVMWIDFFGTWCVGVPLALLSGFVLSMPIYLVYLFLSMEECVRLIISFVVFKKKCWIQSVV